MSDLSDDAENRLARLIFHAEGYPNVADNAASSPLTAIHESLHTSAPGEAGNQSTNEIGYTSYARNSPARSSGGWGITGGVVSPASAHSFPAGTGGSGTAGFLGLGKLATGAGDLLMAGAISPSIVCGPGVTPQITPESTITFS